MWQSQLILGSIVIKKRKKLKELIRIAMLEMCDGCGIKMLYPTLLNNLYPMHAEE
jgi:hypothetical protein